MAKFCPEWVFSSVAGVAGGFLSVMHQLLMSLLINFLTELMSIIQK